MPWPTASRSRKARGRSSTVRQDGGRSPFPAEDVSTGGALALSCSRYAHRPCGVRAQVERKSTNGVALAHASPACRSWGPWLERTTWKPRASRRGCAGLDHILGGGLDGDRTYLVEGKPGSGKTTLAMQFLLEGTRRGERVLYVAMSESRREVELVAKRHGWSLAGIEIFELVPDEALLDTERELTVLHPAEIDLGETTRAIFAKVAEVGAKRVVIDSLSELRLLAQDPLRYRRQVLALKQHFAQRSCTVLLLDDLTAKSGDLQLHSMVHGVILLEQLSIDYGAQRRRLSIPKMRGIDFKGGFHDLTIVKGGVEVYPRLIAAEHHSAFAADPTPSGNADLDRLLGGGLERGTNALLMGAAGVGKSSVALTFAVAAARRGENAIYFAFDEGRGTLETRARTIGLDVEPHIASDVLELRQVDPAELSPGEFASLVRTSVETHGTRVVVIDSLNGYLNAMPDGRFLLLQMHELLSYLNQRGVLSILVLSQHGLMGPVDAPVDISYLSDAVIMLRYFEHGGTMRRAMSVVKKRSGDHEHAIREFKLTPNGIALGPSLTDFTGIFSGAPRYTGDSGSLLQAARRE
ncbi:MAG: AAA family ATPase [Enhydrobacter sp.]|nr:AAA family ATPase [Enhydrobacter sp.]